MRIILCVTNDISTDQRVLRIAGSLSKLPSEIVIVGIKRKEGLPLPFINYRFRRFHLLFSRGPLFYAEYNLRLFLFLLLQKFDVAVANDLDTLPAVYLSSVLKKTKLVYDSHEYFTEVPELVDRPKTKRIWELIESRMMPHIQYASTVSYSVARAYFEKYGIRMQVIRNLPHRLLNREPQFHLRTNNEKIIIYQGALNMGRGLENAIAAMRYLDNVKLVIAGSGYLEPDLKQLVSKFQVHDKVLFTGRLSPDILRDYTLQADLGISLEENKGLNYRYALPNKVFDYIQAGIPVAVSDLPEMAALINQYNIGRVIRESDPEKLAGALFEMLYNDEWRLEWKKNLKKAAEELCWENEEERLLEIYKNRR